MGRYGRTKAWRMKNNAFYLMRYVLKSRNLFNYLGLKKHDVMFLVTIRATAGPGQKYDKMKPFKAQYGVEYVRGCEIEGMLDEQGKVIEEGGTLCDINVIIFYQR